jgi:ABC-2 type transport system permease protein
VSLDTMSVAPPADEPVPYEALGRPIRGPRALTDDWHRFWHLTFNIALTQWKLRFFGSALGYLWQLVRPLLLFLVLYVFFTKI